MLYTQYASPRIRPRTNSYEFVAGHGAASPSEMAATDAAKLLVVLGPTEYCESDGIVTAATDTKDEEIRKCLKFYQGGPMESPERWVGATKVPT